MMLQTNTFAYLHEHICLHHRRGDQRMMLQTNTFAYTARAETSA